MVGGLEQEVIEPIDYSSRSRRNCDDSITGKRVAQQSCRSWAARSKDMRGKETVGRLAFHFGRHQLLVAGNTRIGPMPKDIVAGS